MTNDIDRTPELLDWLKVTPETHNWAYCPYCGGAGGFDRGGFDENGESLENYYAELFGEANDVL